MTNLPGRGSSALIPSLSAGTFDTLPHAKAVGETTAGPGYFVRRRGGSPQYMRLYIGESNFSPQHETGDAPGALQDLYTSATQGAHPFLIEVTLDGQGLLDFGGATYQMKPGEFCFIDFCADHFCRTNPETGMWQKLWIYVAGPCVERYYRAFLGANMHRCRASLLADNCIVENIRAIYDLYSERKLDLYADMRAAALITALLADCVKAARYGTPGNQVPDVIRLVQDYLSQNYQKRITLEMLASRFALDKYHLQKLFTQHVGLSPNEYLIATRMHCAKELLCDTLLPVAEVAECVGMDNASYFIKQFKRREGLTPARYRQLMQPVSQKTESYGGIVPPTDLPEH